MTLSLNFIKSSGHASQLQSMIPNIPPESGKQNMDPHSSPPEDARIQSEPALLHQKGTRRIASSELFAEAQEIQIEHAGETYRLRKTRAGKLILTK